MVANDKDPEIIVVELELADLRRREHLVLTVVEKAGVTPGYRMETEQALQELRTAIQILQNKMSSG